MGREKNFRKLNFKPKYKSFIPLENEIVSTTILLHEEIEAIYLMDVLGYYQEEAAKSMEVSRPTFTRILKNGRQKLATALINGHKINIQDEKDDFIVSLCSDDEKFKSLLTNKKFIYIYKIKDTNIELIAKIDNPLTDESNKPAIVLPKILLDYNTNFFVGSKIGEGLKNSLLSKGIQVINKSNIPDIKDLTSL